MLYILVGENSFEVSRWLADREATFEGDVTKVSDPNELEQADLLDLLTARSLFSEQRLVIIKELSSHKSLWEVLPDWLDRLSDEVTLVLVEPKPDKRTRTYKSLIGVAEVVECHPWSVKDESKAVGWVGDAAAGYDITLTAQQARRLVKRVGLNQWSLDQALRKLALAGEISLERIDEVIESHPEENIFTLFETALQGDSRGVSRMMTTLRQTADPYQTLGLLISQSLQLAAIAFAGDRPAQDIARAIKAHPYVVSKMQPIATRITRPAVRFIVETMTEADMQSKGTVDASPWTVIELALIKIALRAP